ncbi:DSC E3 ubiquitin ligase complex subunit 1 [Exophiala dermatitidis]
MEGPRVVFLVVLLLFIFLTPDQPGRRHLQVDTERIERQRQAELEILTNSTYGQINPQSDSWLNLTGFRHDDGYRWELLATAQDVSRKQYDRAWKGVDRKQAPPIYDRLSGEIRGKFSRKDVSLPPPVVNLTLLDPTKEYMSSSFERNITEQEGELSLSIFDSSDRKSGNASTIRADLSMWTKSSPGNGWQARVLGVHLPSGQIVMSTASSKFNALFALPHFTLDVESFNASRKVMNETVQQIWEKNFEDQVDGLAFAPRCELIVWLQPLLNLPGPVDPADAKRFLQQVEQELEHPEGAPIGQPPPLSFSAVVFSPDCGYLLESDVVFGPKIEAYWTLAQRLLFSFIMVLGLQTALLKRQMDKAATPSTRSRIAYQSIVIAALGDGLLLFALIALLMIDEAAFLMVAATAFLACIHVAFLEVKFIFDIWTVQVGDPARAEHERQRRAGTTTATVPTPTPAPASTSTNRPAAANGLPLPATATRPDGAMPIIMPSDQDTPAPAEIPGTRTSFAAIYSRFYFSLVMLMFFSLWAMSWPRPLRSAYANLLVFCYFSFWWPQIYRNTMRNCRKALLWEYVCGTSLLRTVPILYWYFADNNILSVDTSPSTALVLLGWLWLQVLILVSQRFLGPRLLVPESWCPPAYDYHPVLREDDVEANGMSIGLLASASEAKDKDNKTRKVFDCAICMNEIDVPVVSKNDGGRPGVVGRGAGATWLEQGNYMVTPCRHIFHAECLESWMNLRLVCPVCREALPPV